MQTRKTTEPKLDHADRILLLDKYQGRPDAQRCPYVPDHGRLTVHGSGAALVCGSCPSDPMGGNSLVMVPVDSDLIIEAERWLEEERERARAAAAKARRH